MLVMSVHPSESTWNVEFLLWGLQPTDEKVWAVEKAPTPSNVSQLCSFIGLVNNYCNFYLI